MKTACLLLCPLAAFAALPRPVVTDKVSDRYTPAPFAEQQINGYLASRMKINLEQRLLRLG